ncbi:MAG TPA: aromatic acid exporter family protein [Nocardioidaceae bacterium]|nr:aromatic acid exporter family protein [Nocardioidaceae bacterium]
MLHRALGRARPAMRDPVAWTNVIQVAKTVLAAVLAWVVAVDVFGLPQPFLAPWAALLVVHATVYRSFSRGLQQVAATVLGVLLAWGTGQVLGLDPVALAVMLLVGLLVGLVRGLRAEGTAVAATALIVLTTGYSSEEFLLLGRLFDTGIGVAIGLVVNALMWPPLHDQAAARAIDGIDDQVGELLREIAAGVGPGCGDSDVEAWIERTRELDEEIDRAWGLVRQARESGRLNPRRESWAVRRPGGFGELLDRLEQSLSEIRSMVRTLDHSIADVQEWDPGFRTRWVGLLDEAGAAIVSPDSSRIAEVRHRLMELTTDFSTEDLPARHWPEYGGLILNLRNIVTSMDQVAAATPITPSRLQQRRSVRG